MKLSKSSIGLGIYIVVSGSFMLQVRAWLNAVFGQQNIVCGFKIFFISVAVVFIFAVQRHGFNLIKFILTIAIFIFAYLFSSMQPYFSEKTHIFTYGLLGYLVFRDLFYNTENNLVGMLVGLCFVCLISGLDEIFQYFLPYRVGEMRDFFTNIISGALGLSLFLAKNYSVSLKKG